MILPDVNVLVYAFRREAQAHPRYASWLRGVVAGGEELALHDGVLASALRIVTNRRILADPAPMGLALEFVGRLTRARRATWVSAGARTWTEFERLAASDRAVVGNLVPDAHLAGVAIAHGCRLATADRGFARFPRLDWFDPAA